MNKQDLLEPRKVYDKQLKDLHHQNSINFFDELVKKSGIDIEENKATIKEYKNILDKINKEDKNKRKYEGIHVFLIIVFIFSIISFLISSYTLIVDGNNATVVKIIILVFSVIALAISLYFNNSKIKNKIADSKKELDKLKKEANGIVSKAAAQMKPLNDLFDWNMGTKLMNQTCPLIEFDDHFNPEKYEFLHDRFGFDEGKANNISTLFVQSGSILGNPFLFQKRYIQEMRNKTYSGSITISWTTTEYVNREPRTVHHSQTLTATVTRPEPYYYLDTWLIYGNDAAPKLSFSRKPSNANSMSEKAIERHVKKSEKKLDKMVEQDIGDKDGNGSEFTRLNNTKFESLFQAYNRNNEVEFRLLFTPLAQQNLIDLITTKAPYGDDFVFIKDKKVNYIRSAHTQGIDISCNPAQFRHFDYEEAKKRFVNFNDNYFKGIFFDFAPLISIPLYQQHKTKEYIYKNTYQTNITKYEHEVLVNAMNQSIFKHHNSSTEAILKSTSGVKDGKKDRVVITAHSFKADPRVEYISKLGGDGCMHSIPVHYYEYIPLTKETIIGAEHIDNDSQNEINNDIIKQRGLMAYIINK